jgi:hypothetical protein
VTAPQQYPQQQPYPQQQYPQQSPEPSQQAADPGLGGSRIDAALATLAEVRNAPPAEQVAPLTHAHQVLRETLDSIGDV